MLKNICIEKNIFKIAVFADNNAIAFFNKQGFKEYKIISENDFKKI